MSTANPTDELTVAEVVKRSGFAASALRYYEDQGLISARRTSGGQRRYQRFVLRRLAFIRAATNMGLSLSEVHRELERLPNSRTPTKSDWLKITRGWRERLDQQIAALHRLRDGLDLCMGCGCLSLKLCRISNPDDVLADRDLGAALLPEPLRRSV